MIHREKVRSSVYFAVVRKLHIILIMLFSVSNIPSFAQTSDTVFKPKGRLWGLAYGDFSWKANSDDLNRGGLNQYTGIKEGENLFQFRRIYLGYDYQISARFETNFLLASEDNETTTATTPPVTSGDLLADNKLSMFVKLANVKWKNFIPGGDLSIGQMYTPAAVLTSEVVWDYRCIERTVSDIRRTPTYDMGASLNGKFYNSSRTEIGYNMMVGNGTSAKPENDPYKWFYADVYTKLFNKKVIVDLYSDYSKINWTPVWHHDRSMVKGMIAYTAPKFTVGVEAFYNRIMNDDITTTITNTKDTITNKSSAVSIFARGRIYKSVLGFFIRYDNYNPSLNINNRIYDSYTPITATYDPNTKEQFFTAGIDFSPISKIHIMPNVWYNVYNNTGVGVNNGDDLVYRLSIYYVYGK